MVIGWLCIILLSPFILSHLLILLCDYHNFSFSSLTTSTSHNFLLSDIFYHRRSGVQDRLTVAELRRLVEKLKKRRTSRDKTASVVDYEK